MCIRDSANPANARFQLVGVSDPAMAPKMAEVLGAKGIEHAMVVYADDGLDELSVTSGSTVIEVTGTEVRSWRCEPGELGIAPATMADLRGGDASFNASVIRRVLEGERSARRDIGALNAAAALVVCGRATSMHDGLALALEAIDSGRALEVLENLARISQMCR